MLPLEHDLEVLQGGVCRPQGAGGGGIAGRDREQDHVIDGEQSPNQHRDTNQQQLGFGCNFFDTHFDSLFIMKKTSGSTKGKATTMEVIAKSTWSSRK